LDPSNYWCIRDADLKYSNLWTRTEVQMGPPVDGYPIPSKYNITIAPAGLMRPDWTLFEINVKNAAVDRPPEHRFAVSAYGLPEIDPAIKQPWPMWLWCVMVAAVAVAAMCLFRWLARRRRAPA
jgi:hypothetical protein